MAEPRDPTLDDAPVGWGAVPLVLAAVLVVLAVATGLLELVWPGEPAALVRLEQLPRGARASAGQRLAGVDGRPWSAVLGLSSVRDGIDRDALADAVPERTWLVLSTGGGSFTQLRHLAAPVLVAEPAPDVLVLGVHAAWLADLRDDQVALARLAWTEHRGPVQLALWPWRNRNGMTLWLHQLADDLRLALLPRLGVTASGLYPVATDPFAPAHETGVTPAGAGHRADQLINWQLRGWFEPQTYLDSHVEARALGALVDALRARGTRVLVVRMPGSSTWRARMPAEAEVALDRVLQGRVDPADVLDLSAAVPDALMCDHSHVLSPGRHLVTAKVAAFVRARTG